MLAASLKPSSRPEHNVPRRRLYTLFAAILIMSSISALTVGMWIHNSSQWDAFASEELYLDYLGGRNFAIHGFVNRGFLTDNALDNAPNAPPVYYTHQPSLPIVIIGTLITAGIDDLPRVRLVMILVFLAGLVAVMAFFWQLLSPWHGIAVVAFLGLNVPKIDRKSVV